MTNSPTIGPNQWLRDNALTVLDAVVDAIITMDDTGTIQYANGAAYRMFGYAPGTMIGMDVTSLMPEPHHTRHHTYVENYLRTHQPQIIGVGRELMARAADGRLIPIYLAVSEIPTPLGMFFAGILRDLTQEKKTEAALLEHQARLARFGRLSTMGEMTASIAHEINQPLTAISLYAQACIKLLEVEQLDREKLQSALDKLTRQSLRAGAIVERIQRFVRNETGQRESCDPNTLIGDLEVFVRGDARLHDIELQFELSPDLPRVWCDPIQIQQVVLNLIRNAIDSMHQIGCEHGHQITVLSCTVSDQVEIAVEDCGSGVSSEEAPLMFSAFHSTKADGMGLGLSICRSIINEHGGQLGFKNNPVHGATFYFRLPGGGENE